MNKEIMKSLFPNEVKAVEANLCPMCKKEIDFNEFKDELSRREFKISGLCQHCQDSIFG